MTSDYRLDQGREASKGSAVAATSSSDLHTQRALPAARSQPQPLPALPCCTWGTVCARQAALL